MKFKYYIVLMLFVFAISAHAKEPDSSLLGYIDDKSFFVNIPNGWSQDVKAAKKINAIFLILPNEYDFNNSPAIIYSSYFKNKTVTQALTQDEKNFRLSDPDIKISKTMKFKTKKNIEVTLRVFESKVLKSQPFEAIAYIQEKDLVITFVVSTFSKNNFDIILPYFKKMLSTYEMTKLKVTYE